MSRIKALLLTICTVLVSASILQSCGIEKPAVRVGIIHSLTGTMAFSEKPLVDAITLAIEEVNDKGGVLGHKIIPIIVDGQSNPAVFAKEAERLIVEDHVSVLFGCWTSACRKAVKPVVEKHQQLLFYPVQYEGLEQSPNIVYTGLTPNQQITPSINWAFKHLGKRFFLVGSDYVYPRTANHIIKDLVTFQQGQVLAEHYLPLGSTDVSHVINEIDRLKPDVILNTINGDSNIAFFKALKQTLHIPVISYSIGNVEIAQIGSELMSGHYASWSYFQNIDRAENQIFVANFKKRFGEQSLINDPMEASYTGVYLWAKAVEHAQSVNALRIKDVIGTESFNAPSGVVSVDPITHHLWKTARIGQVQQNGQLNTVWQSDVPIRPVPYPSYQSKKQWRQIVAQLSKTGQEQ